jgi:hypothetical protein
MIYELDVEKLAKHISFNAYLGGIGDFTNKYFPFCSDMLIGGTLSILGGM